MHSADWEMIPFFLAVARAGSLRAGAQLLGANHVTVNRNIKILEASYGVQLFSRSRRGFELTTAGEALLPMAEEAEQSMLSARRRVEGLDRTETGTIRFSLPPMMAFDVVSPILARFHSAYPGINIELRLTDVQEDINRAETDVSLRVAYEVSDDVTARKLFPMAIGTYASQHYVDEIMPKAGPNGAGLNWIGWTGPRENPAWLAQSPFPAATERYACAEGYMHISLMRQGCGLSYLPVIYESFFPDLCRVPGTSIDLDRTIWILLHTDQRRTVRVRRFVDFLSKELRELQPQLQGALYRK
ncbi:LysR family transcriptional regulator [uncultured Shimia sp.]|uniref:LysR family transcriptional regulator n=1 Tax=uncultured Shimia sp. TaxID=573152 RepID=UPI0025CE08C4|nr:LysR family transcriptional regulator [uncultured Shimia sp.]